MQRVKLVYDDPRAFQAAMAIEAFPGRIVAQNPVRRAFSAEVDQAFLEGRGHALLPAGVTIVPEKRYDLENGIDFTPFTPGVRPEAPKEGDMDQVLDLINARDAWTHTQGENVVLAIVDTGVNGLRPEFGPARRLSGLGTNPWADDLGHGTMCAAIAAASRADGGLIDGVAPKATLLPCRTAFYEVELSAIYDALTGLRANGQVVVASNSFGIRTATAPGEDPNDLFVAALSDAIDAGVHVLFSAGNYHDLAGGAPQACDPTSIWLYKCRDDVLTVTTCDQDRAMWFYSSRCPGQFDARARMGPKPDVTAPTPRNGEILYQNGLHVLPTGWGTSGACPQVAGLAALLLSLDPALTSSSLFDYIRSTARDLGFSRNCQGAGLIDCAAAVGKV
ncbi:MAG: S8 family peptidase [Caulobacteraceae bacterium]|nr:S8 family peptidase [Caulobacteraceae bacterium]